LSPPTTPSGSRKGTSPSATFSAPCWKGNCTPEAHHKRGDFWIPLLFVVSDALAIEAAFLLSYWLRFRTPIFDAIGIAYEVPPLIQGYLFGSLVVIGAWLGLFQARKMYGTRRDVNLLDEVFNVGRVVTLGMLIVLSLAFFYREFSYSRIVVVLLWALAILLVSAGRSAIIALERRAYRKGRSLQRALIIGNDAVADQIHRELNRHPSFGIAIVGYSADRPADASLGLARAEYVGPVSAVPERIQAQDIERVFIALRPEKHALLFDLITECEGLNVEFMIVPDVLELLTSQVRVVELEGIPFLKVKGIPLSAWGRITKRAFDLAVTVPLLLLLSPFMALLAFLIRLDSPGPVFFRQKRIGLDHREFWMLKFRSMVQGAESEDHTAGLGRRNDPRRTRLGRILRATSLDELPQLLNVLKGEMSLVGPRPERTHAVESLQESVPKYLDRHRVKTGMTGWAQVNGLRGDTSIAERIKYDLYYIENWSLAFDVKILLRTLRAAFSPRELER
jgi:exopolysaccharide biosynthesis polyprenyl glycosylphosphotransferase